MTATATLEKLPADEALLKVARGSNEPCDPQQLSDLVGPMAVAIAEIEPVNPMGLTETIGDQYYWNEGKRTNAPGRLSARTLVDELSRLADLPEQKDNEQLRLGAKYLLVMFGLAYDPTGSTEATATSYAGALTAYSRERMGELADKKPGGIESVAEELLLDLREPYIENEDVALILAEVEDSQSSGRAPQECGYQPISASLDVVSDVTEPEQITEHELALFRDFADRKLPHINPNEIDASPPSVHRIQENGKTVASLIDTTGYNDDIKKIYAEAMANARDGTIGPMLDRAIKRALKFRAHVSLKKTSKGIGLLVAGKQGSNDRLLRAYFCRIGKDSNGLPLFVLLGVSRTKKREAKLLTVLQGKKVRDSNL